MVIEAAARLSTFLETSDRPEAAGVGIDLLAVSTRKPMDETALLESARKTGRVLTGEEHSVIGGFGGAVAGSLVRSAPVIMDFAGVRDRFAESGPYEDLLRKFGIWTEEIEARARRLVERGAA